jgi:acyl transferase domain-containing protein
VLEALGRLWCAGVEVDWLALQGATPGRRVPLPTYLFDRKRLWIEPTDEKGNSHPEPPVNVDDSIIADGPGIKAGSLEKIIHKQLQIMVEQLEAIGRSRKSE